MFAGDPKIDFLSSIPYYLQLIKALKEKISKGEWRPGVRIPSEPELCSQYGVSRTVVRQALREIELEGLILRKRGKGTFIAEPKISESLVQKLTGFYQDMEDRGVQITTQVLKMEILPAAAKVAEQLKINPGEPVYCIQRLRSKYEEPLLLVTTYLPYALCPGLERYDLSNQSLYRVLEKEYGLVISHGRRTIEAVPANQREAELLKIKEYDPLILLNSVTCLENGVPVEYFHAVHRGDRSRFEVELVRKENKRETL